MSQAKASCIHPVEGYSPARVALRGASVVDVGPHRRCVGPSLGRRCEGSPAIPNGSGLVDAGAQPELVDAPAQRRLVTLLAPEHRPDELQSDVVPARHQPPHRVDQDLLALPAVQPADRDDRRRGAVETGPPVTSAATRAPV